MRCSSLSAIGLAMLTSWSLGAEFAMAQTEPPVDFAREVQPLLARRCYQCHGPDEAEGGLSFVDRESALAELDSGEHAIVPGDLEQSGLLHRVASTDEAERMPPEGKPLSAAEIDVLRRWIAAGAPWQKHWGFLAPRPQAPPAVERAAWVRNPIDAFVLAKLEAAGLEPAPPADKIALLRRVYYDLTGLPPSLEEIAAFSADDSPDAFTRVVERLLASPHYGERWARHWLDLVRYAETNSFERDGPKPHVWRYRYYVIRAFNDDKPYDQFVREQLAGDELPTPTADSLIATGYYRLGVWDDEPADRLQARFDALDDLVSTTGQVFLGLTVNCARCHDHKIDPITQRDYYGLAAFFQNIAPYGPPAAIESQIFIDGQTPEQYAAAVAVLEEKRRRLQAAVDAAEADFRQKYRDRFAADLQQNDLEDLTFRYYRDSWSQLPEFDQLKAETEGPVPSGQFDLGLTTRTTDFGFVFTGMLNVPTEGEYTFYLDSDDGARLTVEGQTLLTYDGIHGEGAERSAKIRLPAGRVPIRLEYFQRAYGYGLQVAWSGPDFARRSLSASRSDQSFSPNEWAKLLRERGAEIWGAEAYGKYEFLRKDLELAKQEKPPATFALCVSEPGPRAAATMILQRGNPRAPGERVEPAFPALLTDAAPQIQARERTSGRRLALAEWIASPDNPMTARVMVNRLWQHHFGRGLVRSSNNFGGLGTPPTHPELLDWLAIEFIQHGWRLKEMHRLIVSSNSYQMSSRADESALAKDPANDLFWRFDRRRLGAEEIRDSILAISGQLDRTLHGPYFFPRLSDEVFATQSKPGDNWDRRANQPQGRRSIYAHVKRSLLVPLLADFDFPDPDGSCEARFITTQPGQALALLNGEFAHQQAVALAARLRAEAGGRVDDQVRLALRLATGREPETASVERGLKLIEDLQTKEDVSAERALDYFCLMVLNLNELIYLD